MKKSQISVEFIFALGVIFFVFLIILGFMFDRRMDVRETEDYLEKTAECMRISSLISSVYAGGDGTIAKTQTKYLITIFNYSLISVEEIETASLTENKIAVLASEAGPTSQTFYDIVNDSLSPDWYKVCFSDLGSTEDCDWDNPWVEEVDWDIISLNLEDLIQRIDDEPSPYTTIYLEDPTIQYNAIYNGKTYLEILQEWVAEGNVVILSEHVMCRDTWGGSDCPTCYKCPEVNNDDIWDIFDVKLHQKDGSYGNDVTVIIEPDLDIFPNLHKDDTFDFEEPSYIEELDVSSGIIEESENLGMVGGFTDTTSCICSSPSEGYCIRHEGSVFIPANATWTSDLEGDYDVKIIYCGESDGDDEWWVYKNEQQIDNWVTSYQSNWQERVIKNVHLSVGDELKLSCDRGTSNSYCRSDYISFVPYYSGTDETADSGVFNKNDAGSPQNEGGYTRTDTEDCPGSGSDRDCTDSYAWEIGHNNGENYDPVDFNATFTFDLSSLGISGSDITSLTIEWGGCWNGGSNYCDNGDNPEFRNYNYGNFEVLIYDGSGYERLSCEGSECEPDDTLLLGDYNSAPSWGNADAYNEFSYTKTSGFTDSYVQDDEIYIRFHTWGTNDRWSRDDIWQEIDYVFLTVDYAGQPSPPEPEFIVVAEYDDNEQPAIAYWDYGNGRVYYFGDFQVKTNQEEYSGILSDVIEKAYCSLIPKPGKESCSLQVKSPYYRITGNITIKNEDNSIIITDGVI